MKQNAFDLQGKTLENIYFVKANFEQGLYGTMEVHRCRQLVLGDATSERVHFKIEGDHFVYALQEPVNASADFRKREPFNRSIKTYIGFGFNDLEIKPTSNQSRFLVLNKRWGGDGNGLSSSFDKRDDQLAFVCDDQELGNVLDSVMEAIGVPKTEQKNFVGDILAKMRQ